MAARRIFALLAIAVAVNAQTQAPQQNQQADAVQNFVSRLIGQSSGNNPFPNNFGIPFVQQFNPQQQQVQQPQQPFQMPNFQMPNFQFPTQFNNFFPQQQQDQSTQAAPSTTTAAPEPQLPVQCILSGGFPQIPGFPCVGTKVDGYSWNIATKTCTKSQYCKSQWGDFGGMQNFNTEEECKKTCDIAATTTAATAAP